MSELAKLGRSSPLFAVNALIDPIHRDLEAIKSKVREKRQERPDLMTGDPIFDAVTDLFDGKVGGPYKPEEYKEIYKKGKERYDTQLPPGYMDKSNKPDDKEQYGDLVLWFQLLDFATNEKRPIILVTDDAKEDWWREVRGEKLGPRPELVDEFVAATGGGKWFYMYSTEQFLKYAKEYLNADVKPEVIREAKGIEKQDAEQLAWLRRSPAPVIDADSQDAAYNPAYYQRRQFPWAALYPIPPHQALAMPQDEVLAFETPQAIIMHGPPPNPLPPQQGVAKSPDESIAVETPASSTTHGLATEPGPEKTEPTENS
jgi:hypothetical protein